MYATSDHTTTGFKRESKIMAANVKLVAVYSKTGKTINTEKYKYFAFHTKFLSVICTYSAS